MFGGLIKALLWDSHHLFLAITLLFVCALWTNLISSGKPVRLDSVPVVGIESDADIPERRERFRHDAKNILLEGFGKFKGKPFYVPSPLGERLVLPPHYVDELKNERDDVIDFVGTFFEMFEGRYTTMGSRSSLHPRIARGPLNANIDQVLDPLRDEIHAAFEDLAPVTEEWTSVNISQVILLVVARASSRMFGGIKLSRDEAWLRAMLDFATDGFVGAQAIKAFPKFIRPLASFFIPALWRIKHHYKVARNSVEPILLARQQDLETSKPSDFLQWMMDDAKGEETQLSYMADILLKMSFAALHTSAASPVQLIYDLCLMPRYIEPLREEISTVMNEPGSLTKRRLMSLRKLDSLMKESQRCNPLLLTTFERIVLKDYTFSDGFVVPAGTQINSPAHAIGMDESVYQNPANFDGFRFAAEDRSSKQVVWAASNLSNMAFGYGKHACPGRFFADFEIKIIMCYILTSYDLKFAEETGSRPENLMVETQMIPNHATNIMLRRRKIQIQA